MKFVALIQARMSSRRLPGKVLLPLQGKPLLQYVVETAQAVGLEAVVATSDEVSDNPIEVWAHRFGVPCYRGPLDDVLGRFRGACEAYPSDVFFRINADSPLVSGELLEMAMARHESGDWDVVTNVRPRTFPPGISVEALRTEVFLHAEPEILDPADREHVVPFFYRHPDRFRIHNIAATESWEGCHLAVDTAEDLARVSDLLEFVCQQGCKHWEVRLEDLSHLTRTCL